MAFDLNDHARAGHIHIFVADLLLLQAQSTGAAAKDAQGSDRGIWQVEVKFHVLGNA